MLYDIESVTDRVPPTPTITGSSARDLEAIMTILELAAICLMDDEDSDFTLDQLLEQARELGGEDFHLDETDVKIVVLTMIGNKGFLKKKPGKRGRLCLK